MKHNALLWAERTMSGRMPKKNIGIVIVIVAIAGGIVGGYFLLGLNPATQPTPVKIFHAGSLTVPFESVEDAFETDHPDLDVQLSPAGSVQCVAWVTESGLFCDVLASADWTLINGMDAAYKDYTIQFATNDMVLCYTDSSQYNDSVNATNFWEYLADPSVEWGFSNPNLDPCGYRSLIVLQLAEIAYSNSTILDDLVIANTDITVVDDGTNYNITTPENLNPTGNVNIRDKSVDLVTLLQEGSLDYAFEYRSVAVQHGLEFIDLENAIDLSNSSLDSDYAKVKVIKCNDDVSTGKSITYGITVPKNADHPDYGALFIEYAINATGNAIFTTLGQPPLIPCPTVNFAVLPTNLATYCVAI